MNKSNDQIPGEICPLRDSQGKQIGHHYVSKQLSKGTFVVGAPSLAVPSYASGPTKWESGQFVIIGTKRV